MLEKIYFFMSSSVLIMLLLYLLHVCIMWRKYIRNEGYSENRDYGLRILITSILLLMAISILVIAILIPKMYIWEILGVLIAIFNLVWSCLWYKKSKIKQKMSQIKEK